MLRYRDRAHGQRRGRNERFGGTTLGQGGASMFGGASGLGVGGTTKGNSMTGGNATGGSWPSSGGAMGSGGNATGGHAVGGTSSSPILEPSTGALLGLYYGDASISATATKLGRTVPLHLTYYAFGDD